MSTLLQKPLKAFAAYALLILVCSVPVYYWVVNTIWLEELDEHNALIAYRIEQEIGDKNIDETALAERIRNWRQVLGDLTLEPVTAIKADSVYTEAVLEVAEGVEEVEHYRGLATCLTINGQAYQLKLRSSIEEADETMAAIALVTTLFFILLVIGFIILNRRISRKLWQPFWATLEKLKTFDLKARKEISFGHSDITEFEELNQTLSKLIAQNVSAYTQQKVFLENASHELQTPLAVLKAKVDVLMQAQNLTEEQAQSIAAITKSLARVNRINKNLLVLAKIENDQFSDAEMIDFGALLEDAVEMISGNFSDREIELSVDASAKITRMCNGALAEALLNNLLVNAVRYASGEGKIDVEMAGTSIPISNPGATALDEQNIFKRFTSASANATSSGLGLAIVKEICNRYSWQVGYQFKNNRHFFAVDF